MASSLHAEIFGSDDSDVEDAELQHTSAPVAAAADSDDEDDRADAILESAQNNLLAGGKKRLKKGGKEKADKDVVGRGGKRKAAPDKETLQKRPKKRKEGGGGTSAEGEAGGSGEGGGEEGAGGAGGADDDADADAMDGDEAIEEGGKNDGFSRVLDRLKGKRGGQKFDRERMTQEVKELQERMEQAVEKDDEAARAEKPRPAIHKVAMLSEVEAMMRKKQYHEVMIDNQMLSTLARWLRPMPDGSLVSLQVRTALLAGLQRFEIDETILGSLRSSGIGKYVKLLTLHRLEQPANKKVAVSLIEKWSRPIFRTAAKFEATEMPIAARAIQLDKVAARKDEAAELGSLAVNAGPVSQSGTRVPRPMGMDFHMLPASEAAPLPSQKYAKESTKGRLQDRILNKKKKALSQAVTLSVEGRGM